jgi:sortase A
MPARISVLQWVERVLLVSGLTLGAWYAAVLIEAHYFKSLPAPPPVRVTMEVPEEPRTHRVAAGEWIAQMNAPSVHLAATVLEGSDDGTLERAAGHIEDTPFPGDPGNVGIAGHRDTTFRAVRNLKVGDPLTLTTADRIFNYKISSMMIVDPEDVYVLDPTDHPVLTLVTCYPFTFIGHAPKRYVIRADLLKEEARTAVSGGITDTRR